MTLKTAVKQILLNRKKLWTPSAISTELWFSFADKGSIILVSNKISQWDDKSGNNRHLSETVDASRPLNGDGVVFDGVNDRLTTSSTFSLPTNTNSFFLVEKNLIGGAPYSLSASTNGSGIVYQSNGGMQPFNVPKPDYTQSIGRMLLVTQGVTTGYVDGSPLPTTGLTSGAYSNTNFSVGRRIVSDLYASGSIYEAMVISGNPSIDIIDRLFGYAAATYGLQSQLPSSHPYKSSPPTV